MTKQSNQIQQHYILGLDPLRFIAFMLVFLMHARSFVSPKFALKFQDIVNDILIFDIKVNFA